MSLHMTVSAAAMVENPFLIGLFHPIPVTLQYMFLFRPPWLSCYLHHSFLVVSTLML